MKKKIVPIEILFSIVTISLIVYIIILLCLEINLYAENINKKMEATRIASSILENIKSRNYDDIDKYISDFSSIGVSKKIEENVPTIIIEGNKFDEKIFGTEIPDDYIVEINVESAEKNFNIAKKVNVINNYYVNNKQEKVELSAIIERQNIKECNEPVISDEYFNELGFNKYEYDITPIKYSNEKKSFVVTTEDDDEWFNYSAKKWAKVLIFYNEADNIGELFINEDGTINESVNYNNMRLDLQEYIYVWIPNFSIKDNTAYFRYGTGKKAIKMDFLYVNGNYLYLNKIAEEIKDISNECSFNGVYGVWKKLGDKEDIYYNNFNLTKYAPINIY